jgi:hypothetical protein
MLVPRALERLCHVCRCWRASSTGNKNHYDLLIWLLADTIAEHDPDITMPNDLQCKLLHRAMCKLMSLSQDHMLSQLLLQLLLLSYVVPSEDDLVSGSEAACTFVKDVVTAVELVSRSTPGDLLFVEVQLSFLLSSMLSLVNICNQLLQVVVVI